MNDKSVGTVTVDNGGASRPRARRWSSTGRADPVARFLAPRLRLSEKAVGHLLHRGPQAVNLRAAEIIRAFIALGDRERLARFLAPIDAAVSDRTPPPLCPATWNLAQEADAAEDCAETAFHADASDANLDRLIRATDREVLRQVARRDALAAEQTRREGAR